MKAVLINEREMTSLSKTVISSLEQFEQENE